MSIPLSSALYYPSIDIKNENWLRSAALFWDSIRTIVPFSYQNPYSSSFAKELNDAGILVPIRVQSDMEEVERLTDNVLDFITDPASTNLLFNTDSSMNRRIHPEKMPYQFRELVDIHSDKLPYMIRNNLEHLLDGNGSYQVTSEFANFYMTLLAAQLSERIGTSLITESTAADQLALAVHKGKAIGARNSKQAWQRGKGNHFDAYGERRVLPVELSQSLLIDTTIQGIALPPHVTAKELLKFKEDHYEELALFRKEITKLTSELPKESSIEALRQALDDQYNAQVRPAMHSLKTSLKAQKWDAALNGILKVSCFAAPPTSVAIFAGLPTSIALAVGAGLSITATIVQCANQTNKIRSENPYSYLLSLQREW